MRRDLGCKVNRTNCLKPLLINGLLQLHFSNQKDKIGTLWMSLNIR